jgi:uroporphyrin-3 C-methyltransferase
MRRWSRLWLHTSAAQVKEARWTTQRPAAPAASRAAPRAGARLFAIALVLLAVIVAALWLDTRGRIGATQEELAKRLRDIETESRDARSAGRQAQEGLRDVQAKVGALEAKLAESQNQQVALEALYQELARNRDEWQLAEIEQVLAIAQQQLQLSGNVRAACWRCSWPRAGCRVPTGPSSCRCGARSRATSSA